MKQPVCRFFAPMLVLTFAFACSEPTNGVRAPQRSVASSRNGLEQVPQRAGHDQMWMDLSRRIAGFGGMYFNDDGDLVVVLKDTSKTAEASAALAGFVGQSHRPKYLPSPHAPRMLFAAGRYDYLELVALKDLVSSAVSKSNANAVAIDEVANGILVGVDDGSISLAHSALVAASVPENAVHIVSASRSHTVSDTIKLRNTTSPLVGGNRFWVGGTFCTLGLPVKWGSANSDGFISAGHCARLGNGFGDTLVELGDSTFVLTQKSIGSIIDDGSATHTCSHGTNCKWSDAALFTMASGVTTRFAAIARGTALAWALTGQYWSPSDVGNPIAYDHRSYWGSSTLGPFEMISQEAFQGEVVGEWVSKVGQTTGWTVGQITNASYDVHTDEGYWILQSVQVHGGAYAGDSGAGVFVDAGTTTSNGNEAAKFYGILFSADSLITDRGRSVYKSYTYSPIYLIQTHLGNGIAVD